MVFYCLHTKVWSIPVVDFIFIPIFQLNMIHCNITLWKITLPLMNTYINALIFHFEFTFYFYFFVENLKLECWKQFFPSSGKPGMRLCWNERSLSGVIYVEGRKICQFKFFTYLQFIIKFSQLFIYTTRRKNNCRINRCHLLE